jgi:hypothetical protein
MHSLDLDPVTHEHLQAERRAVQGVAFGHVGNTRRASRAGSLLGWTLVAGSPSYS